MLEFTVKINGQAQLTLTITPLAGLFKSESFSASLGNIVQHTLSMQPMLVLLRSINLQSPSLPIARSILVLFTSRMWMSQTCYTYATVPYTSWITLIDIQVNRWGQNWHTTDILPIGFTVKQFFCNNGCG